MTLYYIHINSKWYKEGSRVYLAKSIVSYLISDNKVCDINLDVYPRYHNLFPKNSLTSGLNKKADFIIHIAEKYKVLGGTLIYFGTKSGCEQFVKSYIEYKSQEVTVLSPLLYPILAFIRSQLSENHLLVKGIEKGILYHHGSLPLDIREAVEEIYLKGYIKLLASTSTLVEGVNFPIQTLIYTGRVYKDEPILNLIDYTNIIGRAGRAFQNTYGQIIHINFSRNLIEEHLFYEDKKKEIHSSLLNNDVIEQLENIIDFSDWVNIDNSDFLKHLVLYYLDFEINSYEELINILRETLFVKQADEAEIRRILAVVKKFYNFISEYDKEDLHKIKLSGLAPVTYESLKGIAAEIVERIELDYVEDLLISNYITRENYESILFLAEARPPKLSRRKVELNHYDILIDWTQNGLEFEALAEKYFSIFGENEKMNITTTYIQDLYEYRLPIIFSCLGDLVLNILDNEDLKVFIKNFSYMIKKGLNTKEEVVLYKLGINSRRTIKQLGLFLASKSINNKEEIKDFLLNLEPSVYKENLPNISDYEIKKSIQVVHNLRELDLNRRNYSIIFGDHFTSPTEILLEAKKDDSFNPFAVEIRINNKTVYYVPIIYTEEISRLLDLNKKYVSNIIKYSETETALYITFEE